MPQHKSAKKRVKTNLKKQNRNRAATSALRRCLRRYRELAAENKAAAYPELQAALDKAANKGIFPKNRASRMKSRLTP